MTPDEYQQQASRTENTPLFIEHGRRLLDNGAAATRHDQMLSRLIHAVLGMITELGEFCDPLKRHLIYGAELNVTNMGEESGDSAWYWALAANAMEMQLAEIFERNIAKLRARYPDKFTSEKALNRDLDAEKRALEGGTTTIVLPDGREVALGDPGTMASRESANVEDDHRKLDQVNPERALVLVGLITSAMRYLSDNGEPLNGTWEILNEASLTIRALLKHFQNWQRCADILACENKPEVIIRCLRILVDEHQKLVLAQTALQESHH